MSPNTMLGNKTRNGPGGRDCACCGQPPGFERKTARRTAKRRERQELRKTLSPKFWR